MQLADSAESGDCQTKGEIAKYLFVSPHRVAPTFAVVSAI